MSESPLDAEEEGDLELEQLVAAASAETLARRSLIAVEGADADAVLAAAGVLLTVEPPQEDRGRDEEILRMDRLKRDVEVRHRRLSQLEDYVGRIETVVEEQAPAAHGAAAVVDAELTDVLGQLEEELSWAGSWKSVQDQMHAGLRSRALAMRSLLEAAFRRYDDDGDGALNEIEFSRYVRETFPEQMAAHVDGLFRRLDKNGDGLIQQEEFLEAYAALGADEEIADDVF